MPVTTYTNAPAVLDDTDAANKNGTVHRGGKRLFTAALTNSTAVKRVSEECRREYLDQERIVTHAMPLAFEKVSGLTGVVRPGDYRKSDGTAVAFPETTIAVTASQTAQLIWIVIASNTLDQGAAWPADITTFIPIAQCDTDGAEITEGTISSKLPLLKYQINASSTSPTGTTGTSFTLDDDNAGAGANCQLRANRGSSDAEDAALEWDEANDRWNVRAQHTTATLAPINASAVKVAGSDVVNSSGKVVAGALNDAAILHTVGANGATVAGLKLTPAGGTGSPAAGAHTVGEFAMDSAGVVYVCTAAGTPGTWQVVGNQNTLTRQVSIPDATGHSAQTVSIQVKDSQGANVAEVTYVQIGVYQDADGAANATNATIAVGGTGTLVKSITATKVLIVKTDNTGRVDIVVTDGTLETVYLLAAATVRSRLLDCSDIGTVVIN